MTAFMAAVLYIQPAEGEYEERNSLPDSIVATNLILPPLAQQSQIEVQWYIGIKYENIYYRSQRTC